MSPTVFTRDDYLAAPGPISHRRYYAQAVTPELIATVVRHIGAAKLRASTQLHLNDIPLPQWDALQNTVRPYVVALHKRIGLHNWHPSLSDCVCAAKESARQWLEAQS